MKTENLIPEIETDAPAEIVSPAVDALSQVFDQVQAEAPIGAPEYLEDTIVSQGGE